LGFDSGARSGLNERLPSYPGTQDDGRTEEVRARGAARVGRRRRSASRRLRARALDQRLARLRARVLDQRLARLRALLRADEIAFVALAALVGAGAGVAVTVMSRTTQLLHELLFAIEPGAHLSASSGLEPWRVVGVPVLGGLLLGAVMSVSGRFRSRQVVDPIEANALYGGRMSLLDSLGVGLETMISNGAGASVGLEAGYSQVGSGLASTVGGYLRPRRNDLRILVGCGAAGAIGGAFDAPLTGAFYAFELVIGGYAVAALAPVVASALIGAGVAKLLAAQTTTLEIVSSATLTWQDQLLLLPVAGLAALAGIGLMVGVTYVERIIRGTRLPRALRPALGGVAVGGLALVSHQVLASGHGALANLLVSPLPLREIALVLLCKALASAISIGSGFRGGLFFTSLFMGALTGTLVGGGIDALVPSLHADPQAYALIGMSSMAVAVVGGPMTMVFMALEMTGGFALAPWLIAGVLIAALASRRLFGFSFATWRFHLRGEAIRGAHDIGWIRNLTVGRLMRRDARTVRADTLLAAFRRQFPLGSTGRVVALDEAGRYAGLVLLPEAHGPELDDKAASLKLEVLLRHRDVVLLPSMNVKEAATVFDTAAADALAVVDDPERRRVLGILTEAHALRRYSEELDQRRRELVGEL
jgi:CIC family chloride channel protein